VRVGLFVADGFVRMVCLLHMGLLHRLPPTAQSAGIGCTHATQQTATHTAQTTAQPTAEWVFNPKLLQMGLFVANGLQMRLFAVGHAGEASGRRWCYCFVVGGWGARRPHPGWPPGNPLAKG
jgi:hypothetical protein